MRVRGVLVHLFKGGWALYRIRGGAPLPKELRETPEAPGHLEAEGGLLLHVVEGEIFPVKVRVGKPRKHKGGESGRAKTKRKALVGPVTKAKASKP